MKGNVRRWFAIAGICCAAGIALMMAALAMVGFDVRQLQMPIPMGISMPGVPAASEPAAAPAEPAEPAAPAKAEAPAALADPAAPSVAGLSAEAPTSSMTVAASAEPASSASEEPSASFGFGDKLALGLRSLSYVADVLW